MGRGGFERGRSTRTANVGGHQIIRYLKTSDWKCYVIPKLLVSSISWREKSANSKTKFGYSWNTITTVWSPVSPFIRVCFSVMRDRQRSKCSRSLPICRYHVSYLCCLYLRLPVLKTLTSLSVLKRVKSCLRPSTNDCNLNSLTIFQTRNAK